MKTCHYEGPDAWAPCEQDGVSCKNCAYNWDDDTQEFHNDIEEIEEEKAMKKYEIIIDVCCAMKVEIVAEDEDRAAELAEEYTQSENFFTECRKMCEFCSPEVTELWHQEDTDETEERTTAVEVWPC